MDSRTWCRTPAFSSAASRFRVTVPKKSTICASSWDGVLVTSMSASAPRSASARPLPVYASTPAARLSGTAWCPARASAVMVSCPIRPVPPAIAIRMESSLISS